MMANTPPFESKQLLLQQSVGATEVKWVTLGQNGWGEKLDKSPQHLAHLFLS